MVLASIHHRRGDIPKERELLGLVKLVPIAMLACGMVVSAK